MPDTIASREKTKNVWPRTTSRTRNGVASWAWNCRVHRIPAITGYDDSKAAICMHTAASIPGAT